MGNLTSVERLIHYARLDSEKEVIPSEPKPVQLKCLKQLLDRRQSTLDNDGTIEFDKVTFRYYSYGPTVLNELSLKINHGEKIGVVGRTGAGKSSLISAIFRIANISSGTITIGGHDTSKIKLAKLRQSLSIIPQAPTLLTETIRGNIDPTLTMSDDSIWTVLRQVQLDTFVQKLNAKLDTKLEKSGDNLSMGQKQLLCLGRALLKKTQILLIDEATANVDPYTDRLIQETIRKEFSEQTVLTIAHRLDTIIDYDRIFVMDSGKLVESGTPNQLLSDSSSNFYALATKSKDFASLLESAKKRV